MSDTVYRVRVVYDVQTSQAAGGLAALGGAAGSAKGALGGLQGKAGGLGSVLGGLGRAGGVAAGLAARGFEVLGTAAAIGTGAAIGGLASLMRHVVSVGQQSEETGIAVAGMLEASNTTSSWSESMGLSASLMSQIRRDAAVLPGEAEDFVTIFRAGLPKMLENGLDPAAAAKLSNRTGAVGITMGIDAEQIGRDVNLIMGGHAGAHVRTWTAMQDAVRRAGKELHLAAGSAKEFNKLSGADRVRVWEKAVGKYQHMIDAFQDTWSAQFGTLSSNITDLFRIGGQPLFEESKGALKDINTWFDANRTSILSTARALGDALAGAFHRGRDAAGGLGDTLLKLARGPAFSKLLGLINGVGTAPLASGGLLRSLGLPDRTELSSLLTPRTATAAAGLAGMAVGVPGAGLVAGGMASMALEHPADAGVALGALGRMGDDLSNMGGNLFSLLSQAEGFVGDLLSGILPGLTEGLAAIMDSLTGYWNNAIVQVSGMIEKVRQPFTDLSVQVGGLLSKLGNLAGSIIPLLGGVFIEIVDVLSGPLLFALNGLVFGLTKLASGINFVLSLIPGTGQSKPETGTAPALTADSGNAWTMGDHAGFSSHTTFRQPLNNATRTPSEHRGGGGSSKQKVEVKIEQTIHDASDPDRVLIDTRRAVHAALSTPLESANGRTQVLR